MSLKQEVLLEGGRESRSYLEAAGTTLNIQLPGTRMNPQFLKVNPPKQGRISN